jgi:tRNA threonylcarbamoyladenosine biosynthesis protein TsaB
MAVGQVKSQKSKVKILFAPMIDAKRMEVYCAVYDKQLKEIKKTSAAIIDENSFTDLLEKNKIYFFGDGAEKCKSKIKHPNAVFIDNVNPSAQFMLPIAERYFNEKKFEDLAYFEPFYLKDFVGTKSSP